MYSHSCILFRKFELPDYLIINWKRDVTDQSKRTTVLFWKLGSLSSLVNELKTNLLSINKRSHLLIQKEILQTRGKRDSEGKQILDTICSKTQEKANSLLQICGIQLFPFPRHQLLWSLLSLFVRLTWKTES